MPDEAPLVAELVASIDRFIGEKETKTLPALVHAVMMHGAGLYRRAIDLADARSVAALNTFYRIAAEYDAITREAGLPDFLDHLRVMAGFRIEVETETDEDAVQVMTVHKSKGTEFPAVFVLRPLGPALPAHLPREEVHGPARASPGASAAATTSGPSFSRRNGGCSTSR